MKRFQSIIVSLIPWLLLFLLNKHNYTQTIVILLISIGFLLIVYKGAITRMPPLDWMAMLFMISCFIELSILKFIGFLTYINIYAVAAIAISCWLSLLCRHPLAEYYVTPLNTKTQNNQQIQHTINVVITVVWAIVFSLFLIIRIVRYQTWNYHIWIIESLPIVLLCMCLLFTVWFPEWYRCSVIGEYGLSKLKHVSEKKFVSTPLATICYRTIGKGPLCVLFLPSYVNMYHWDPTLVAQLSKHFKVIVFDYPEVGESSWSKGEYNLDNFTKALEDFIDSFNKTDITLLGYSMGSWFTQLLAICRPDLVKQLILIASDVGGYRSSRPKLSDLTQLMRFPQCINFSDHNYLSLFFDRQYLTNHTDKVNSITQSASLIAKFSSAAALLQQQIIKQWYSSEGTYHKLGYIQARTLIISGGKDKISNRQNALLLVNGIGGAQLLELDEAGHGMIYQYPTEISNAIINLSKSSWRS